MARSLRGKLARLLRPRTPERTSARDDAPRAATIGYAPRSDGRPDPGEVVWAWVPYEDDPSQGKDRPVLLIGQRDDRFLGLMLTSKDHDLDAADEARHGRHWLDVGAGGWDRGYRRSEVRLDRLLELEPAAIRREGAALSPDIFARVVVAAREHHTLG